MSQDEYFDAFIERFPGDVLDTAGPREGETLLAGMERVARELGIREVEESVAREVESPDNVVCDVTMPVTRHG